jgi:8-oxo-dGTP diphosphatase
MKDFDTINGLKKELEAVDILTRTEDVAVAVTRNTETGKYLLMKRAMEKKNYPGRWEFPAGVIEKSGTPEKTAIRELREETGLEGEIIREAESFSFENKNTCFNVHPFLIEVGSEDIEISWEHSDYEWLELDQVLEKETVDGLRRDLELLDLL